MIPDRTLYLDAGNTRIKAAAYENGEWKPEGLFSYDEYGKTGSNFAELCRKYDEIVMVSVKKRLQAEDLQKQVSADVFGIDRRILTHEKHRYRTPETLGIDRYLACLGAWSLGSPNPSAVIVSDAGTACTVDAMNAEGVYLGGVIMPGLHMLIDTLDRGADGLFTVAVQLPEFWPPDTTESALQAGTAGTFLAAWETHVKRMQSACPNATIWLTGGDAGFLNRHTEFDCKRSDFLVFEGMRLSH